MTFEDGVPLSQLFESTNMVLKRRLAELGPTLTHILQPGVKKGWL